MANDDDIDDEEPFENSPSDLDELTHKELCLIYQESSAHILFAKAQQWRTLGATLIMFIGFLTLVKIVSREQSYIKFLTASTILIALTSIVLLIIYQFWQHTEQKKINSIAKQFSSLSRKILGYKQAQEANAHRYIMLLIMITGVIMGGAITYMGMNRWY